MLKFHLIDSQVVAELTDDKFIICHAQDVLDLMGDLGLKNCNRIILYERNLLKDFFILQTGIAGEILQKFSNYRFKLAIVGDFSGYKSNSLQDFIRESNKGNTVFFVDNFDKALSRLKGK